MAVPRHSRTVYHAFTLTELLAVIGILAILVGAVIVYVPGYINWARQISDQNTLQVLNDAVNRYKTQGGDVRAFTAGTPIAGVIAKLKTPVNWAGMEHQFLQSGFTVPGRSLKTAGDGAHFRFYSYGHHSDSVPAGVRMRTYLDLPGTDGSYASTPDSPALSITGDIDLRWYGVFAAWPPTATGSLISKRAFGNQNSYTFYFNTGPDLVCAVSPDGQSFLSEYAHGTVPIVVGTPVWLRATLDVDNGAGKKVWQFHSSTNGVDWSPIGGAIANTPVASIYDGTALVEIGSCLGGGYSNFAGKVYCAEIRNGVDGPVVASPDFSLLSPGTTSLTDAQGNVWTIHGGAAIVAE